MIDSRAFTKIQIVFLISIIIVAIGGSLAYVLLSEQAASETIKVGVLDDLGYPSGDDFWQGVVLAAEQLNAKGGILGKQVEIVGGDTDSVSSNWDPALIDSAITRLLTYDKVDFIIGVASNQGFMIQERIYEHKTIFIEIGSNEDAYTQRVLDEYDRYKYFFRASPNATSIFYGMTDGLSLVREQTGFNKIGFIVDEAWTKEIMDGLNAVLPELGFELVYEGKLPPETVDFTSYFAAAESAGTEILVPLIAWADIPFVKEYHERQSPMIVHGGYIPNVLAPEGWETTEGKCQYVSAGAWPTTAGYPLTEETLPFREAYIHRWNEIPGVGGSLGYDVLRYVLSDAVERAGTLEVEAVIEALEKTSIETSMARNFVFTSSHDSMTGENPNDPEADYYMILMFQWVDGKQVPVYPKKIMEEAGATYTYPDWPGAWD